MTGAERLWLPSISTTSKMSTIHKLIIRLFRIQYKTPTAEVCDYFRNSTLEEIARFSHAVLIFISKMAYD